MAQDEIRKIMRSGGTNPDYLNQKLDDLNYAIKKAKREIAANGRADPAYLKDKISRVAYATDALMNDITAWAYRKGIFKE